MTTQKAQPTTQKTTPATSPQGGFSPRHLVNMGVFAAIYVVILFATGMLGIFNPIVLFLGWAVGILLSGSVVMLYLVKTPIFGCMTILGVLVGLIMAPAHAWYILIVAPLLGVLADVIVRAGKYRSRGLNILAYAVFTLWYIVPLIPITFASESYYQDLAQRMSPEYSEQMRALFQPWLLGIWGVCFFLLALLGAWVGTRLTVKHFTKAGITS